MQKFYSDHFFVTSRQLASKVLLQQISFKILSTKQLPGTYDFLSNHLESIFENQCFNIENLPFKEEVRSTELGHLLEHMILEILKKEVERDFGKATFRGETRWDWSQQETGTFQITIHAKEKYSDYFQIAFAKASKLLDQLITDQLTKN